MGKSDLFIVVEGGVVQSVCSADPSLTESLSVILIDYDTDGADEGKFVPIRRGDDSVEPAVVVELSIEPTRIECPAL